MSLNKNFFKDVAQCRELTGNDMRLILLCYSEAKTQYDIINELGWKKTNTSAAVNKLVRMQILTKVEMHGARFYKLNKAWKNDQVSGQMNINQVLK